MQDRAGTHLPIHFSQNAAQYLHKIQLKLYCEI